MGTASCGSQNRAGRTPPPREARKLTMFVAFRPGVQPAPKNKPILYPFLLNSSSAYNSPPRGVAANCAAQRAAEAQLIHRPNSVGFGPRATIYHHLPSGSACRPSPRGAPRLGDKAGDSANRATRSRPKARQKALPKSKPHARRGTARKPITVFEPKEQHSPKQNPVLRLVSASLRLRFRSAAFSRAWAIHSLSACRRKS